jgi:D-serine deaminase-like pyridoxal phosphate-dependent protein
MLINEQRCKVNIKRMVEKANKANVRLRPHFKTHQSLEIGEWFREQGVDAITVSSVDMAEYFASGGWRDITIAFPVNTRQINQINALAAQIHIGILVENVESLRQAVEIIDSSVDFWIKIDSGSHRTGISWDDQESPIQLIELARKKPKFVFKGLLTHAGNTYTALSKNEAINLQLESISRLLHLKQSLTTVGYDVPEISIGDTPGCSLLEDFSFVDEIRPGNFIFYDSEQFTIGSCAETDIAVGIVCPVVARHPDRNEIVIYGGAIHLSKESYRINGNPSYGIISVPEELINKFPIGSLVVVLPIHSCLTAHLMRRYINLDGKTIEMMPI